jgi:LuxR family maltose regulon positive regulatory protein
MMSDWRVAAGLSPDAAPSRLLKVKTRAPLKPDHYVRRPRLHRLVDEAVRGPVTLVVAPAGAGKTSLLSGWADELEAPVCWLTADETDRDVVQLWSGVMSSLDAVAPRCSEQAQGLLRHPESVFGAIDQLAEDLESLRAAATYLIVDDLHLVVDDALVAASLAHFVEQTPASLHVILASRRVPKLPLDRLRARGSVGEVHFAELRFSPGESAQLLAHLAPEMPGDKVSAACANAEGWAAGLQLAALAARSARAIGGGEPPSMGIQLLVHDFVWHEVLGHEDPELVEVLSDIAVVDRVGPGLASSLTGRQDASDLLLRAEERGLFVNRLGPDGWFEVHAQVRTALLTELTRKVPSRVARQHARAACWFEASGELPQALDHWLLADQPRQALRLLAGSHCELYETGREATIRRTITAIPPETSTADLDAMIDFAWCHLLIDPPRFVRLVEQLTWWTERQDTDEQLRGRVRTLESSAASITGDVAAGGRLAREALQLFGDGWWRDPLGSFGWNTIAQEIALTESWDDQADEVRQIEHALSRDPARGLAFEGMRAVGEALAGWPVDALRVAAGVRGTASVEHMTVLESELALAEAISRREIGDRARAQMELEALVEPSTGTTLYCRILALLEMAQAHLDDNDPDRAGEALLQAEGLAEAFGPDGQQRIARLGTRLALATSDLDSARRRSAQIDDCFWGPVSRARVQLATGDRAAAYALLDIAAARCNRHDVVLALLWAQCVEDRDKALKYVTTAVDGAAAAGMLQTVVSEGADILQLVERAAWRAPQSWMERLRRAAVGRAGPEMPGAREPLTERERDVLRFLPSRLTIGEIADELYISPNTLKFHLKVIYRKLGVNSRAEAAEAARRLAANGPHQV